MMKKIGHIATPYELEAIDRLKAIVIPLVPEPAWNKIKNCWEWKVPGKEMTIGWFPHFNMQVDEFPYQVGDRIYFQEDWCKGDWGTAFDDDIYFTKSTTPEAENIGWQTASTMPPEAARYWFEIIGVRVVQAKYVFYESMRKAGFYFERSSIVDPWEEIRVKWDTAYPEQQWCPDRWVITLDVRSVSSVGTLNL